MNSYLERLSARTSAVGSVLCVGMDPQVEALPDGFAPNLKGLERFCEVLLDATMPYAAPMPVDAAMKGHGELTW